MEKYVEAVQWMFGMNKNEAEKYVKKTDQKMLNAILEGFQNNGKKSFYND